MTENMPGGKAIKPGDILTGASGLTVEVNNTDAEGRLILGDGLWYARQLGATHLIDVATLTGAIVVGLGKITTGLFGTPQPWVDHIEQAADRAGEKVWAMPLFDEYKEQLKSEIADMLNSPGPAGGIDHRGDVPEGVRRRRGRGRTSISPAPRGRKRASRGSRRAPPAR